MLKPDNFTWPYYFMHLICRLSCYVFYRRIHIVGKENFPMEGPVIICGTHSNQFVDAIMLIAKSPRMVHFVIADSVSIKLLYLGLEEEVPCLFPL